MRRFNGYKRLLRLAAIAVLLTAAILPAMPTPKASAYAILGARFIKMSSSAISVTNTTYNVSFTVTTTGNIRGIVVDFCGASPIIGDTCAVPTGFTITGTPAIANQTNITGFSADDANSGRTLVLTNGSGGSVSATTVVSFDITTVTNPSTTNATFYARILTYANATGANSPDDYTGDSTGATTTGSIDAGGIALSTANQLTVTSKVQERLTFCVYTGANCAAGGSAITLGDTNGVLDPSGAYVDKTGKYDVATNASGNVAIRVKGVTLTSGGNTITAIGGTAAASSPGSEQFGFCTYQASGSGLTPSSPYNHASCSSTSQTAGTGTPGGDGSAQFAFDTTNTNTTYGQTFASKTPGATSQGILAFIGNISFSTEAGIYATTLTFIATGTY